MDLVDLPSQLEYDYYHGRFNNILETAESDIFSTLDPSQRFSIKLTQLAVLHQRGMLIKGRRLIEELDDEISSEFEDLQLRMWKAQFLLELGKNEKALTLLDNISTEITKIDKDEFGECNRYDLFLRLLKSLYYANRGEADLALNYSIEAYHLYREIQDRFFELRIYENYHDYYKTAGNFDKADQILREILEISKDRDNRYQQGKIYLYLSRLAVSHSNFEEAKEYIDKTREINSALSLTDLEWHANNNEAIVLQYTSDLDQAKKYYLANESLVKDMDSDIYEAITLNNLGAVYNLLGDVDLALEYVFRSLEIYERLGNKNRLTTSYNNISINYLMKGELDRALEFLDKSMEILNEVGTEQEMATAYVNKGQVYHIKGEYEKAEYYYKKCLTIDSKFNHDLNLSEVYYNLITLSVEIDEIEDAKIYMYELEKISSGFDNKLVDLRLRLARVQILKTSARSVNKAKAQEILYEIVDEEPIDFELYVAALLFLCDLLLLELKQTGEDEVFQEIKKYVNVLHQYALSQKSYIFLAESYLIKSKIAQLEMDFQQAQSFIENAEQVSYNKGMDKLALKISSHYDQLLDQMKKMEELYDKDSSIKDRLEEVQLQEVFLRMINTKTDELRAEPEEPSMFIIIQEGGSTLYRRTFQEELGVKEELIAGLFSALFTLSDEVFNTQAKSQRIRHEEFTIIMKTVERKFLFCYVFRGQSFNAMKKLERVTESIIKSKTIWDALNREVSYLTSLEKSGMDLIVDEIFLAD